MESGHYLLFLTARKARFVWWDICVCGPLYKRFLGRSDVSWLTEWGEVRVFGYKYFLLIARANELFVIDCFEFGDVCIIIIRSLAIYFFRYFNYYFSSSNKKLLISK